MPSSINIYICSWGRKLLIFIVSISGVCCKWPMHPKKLQRRPRRRRLKPNIPTSPDDIDCLASHLVELSCVLDMLKTIMAATKDIVQGPEVGFIYTDINIICEETDNVMNHTPLLFNREGVTLHQCWLEYWGCRHDSRKKSCRSLNLSLLFRHSKAAYKLTTCEWVLMISLDAYNLTPSLKGFSLTFGTAWLLIMMLPITMQLIFAWTSSCMTSR